MSAPLCKPKLPLERLTVQQLLIFLSFVLAPNISSALEVTCEREADSHQFVKTEDAFEKFFPATVFLFSRNAQRIRGRETIRFEEFYFDFHLTPTGAGVARLFADVGNDSERERNAKRWGPQTFYPVDLRYYCDFNSIEVLLALESGAISDPSSGQQPTPSKPPASAPKVVKKAPRKPLTLVGSGSGFFVSHDGYLVTNNHVTEGCEEVRVRWDGSERVAKLHNTDPTNDLALLSTDVSPETIVSFSPNKVSLVETIFVGGFPFGTSEVVSDYVKVTKGIVSSLAGFNNNLALFQMDAAIQPGSSGGPIINDDGYLVGVSVGAVNKFSKGFEASENQNFGIKSRIVEALLDANAVEYRFGDRSNNEEPSLGEVMANATLFLTCWMTDEQIKKAQKKRN